MSKATQGLEQVNRAVAEAAKPVRPECCNDEHLDYLDELRESGETNMFGAAPYVQREFGLDREQALAVLMYWMETFGNSTR